MRTHKAAVIFSITLFLFGGSLSGQTAQPAPNPSAAVKTESFFRTELYFGRSKPGGGNVSDDDWNAFLADVVTPRFPDGFTELKAIGQYREKSGRIVSEPSNVLVFFYSKKAKNESRTKIEEIRAAYIKRFEQESVLRVDLPKAVRVSF
ncbi:MAG: DUF3574 domain-containing protein [Acidobacteria bacterium]|nr:DUF3574 domain-containing protein [Acidobacteriota bacterium]